MPTPLAGNRLTFSPRPSRHGEIGNLPAALAKIGLAVAPAEVRSGTVGPTTIAAIEAIQKRAGLQVTGTVTPGTVDAVNAELTHVFYTGSKKRTAQVQEMLARTGHPVDAAEAGARRFGDSSKRSLAAFAESVGMQVGDGRISDDLVAKLQAQALTARFSTKTQVAGLQRVLGRVNRIAKLNAPIGPGELRSRELGPTTQTAIRAFQQKYKLPVTGELDPATYAKLVSVANSRPRPPALLTVRSAEGLAPISRTLRLNMKTDHVGGLQRALAFLGYKIGQKEFDTRTFGGTTRAAVLAYQRVKSLPLTGHVEGATREELNADLQRVLPPAPPAKVTYHVRGSVRDSLWHGKAGVRVQARETALRGDGTLLGERKTLQNGFFDIPYSPPRNAADGSIKQPFQLQVRVLDVNGAQATSKVRLAPTPVTWVNFTDGDQPYRGTSEYETEVAAVMKVISSVAITDLKETDAEKEITYVALHSGLAAEEVMRLVLSHRVATELADSALTPDAVYAFIGQNYPPGLPSDLLGSTVGWTQIDALVKRAAQGIVFMEPDAQAQVLDQAAPANLVPIAIVARRQRILDALAAKRLTFALSEPILTGNGTLQSMLTATPSVPAASHHQIAAAFLAHGGMGAPFWDDLRARADTFGGAHAIADLQATAQLGAITKHDEPTFRFLKAQIADPANQALKAVSDTAKLDHADWKALIAQNQHVPAGIPGTPEEQADVYATALVQQAERLFPSIALAAHAARSNANALTHLPGVRKVLDEHSDLNLAQTSVAAFVKSTGNGALDPNIVSELKVLQRVQRIAPDAATASALLDQKLHHSAQIVFLGQEQLAQTLAPAVDRVTALTVSGKAELQYAQVLAVLGEFRAELHRANPAAIINQTYTPEEQAQLAGDIPDLETLFGALDSCDCSTCQSLYGPAAYVADVLRFIDSHLSQQPPKTVRGVLFDRRPDIGNIKLNCQNTETPLPYVDLVCEILEAAVSAPDAEPAFDFQTTRSAEELRAFPENVRQAVYDWLRTADFPLDRVFDLWQQEAQVWLDHLGVPRWQLMEWLQARPQGGAASPTDTSIAGEFFGLSPHETALVTTVDAAAARQYAFWGFDCTQPQIGVEDFLAHSKLTYEQLLQLMQVQWLNVGRAPGDLAIDRPAASCALPLQKVTNLTLVRFDRIHRFIRLWRRSGWQMWELDRLLRAERIGNGTLDAEALARLKQARQVQQKLGISVDALLAFYGELNTETRTEPDDPAKPIDSFYITLFQNPRVTDPVDSGLALDPPLAGSVGGHKQAISTALGIGDADFDRLAAQPNAANLTLECLSRMYATITLARTTGLTIERLLRLAGLCGIADVFAAPRRTLDFLELRDWVSRSGFGLDELDFVLNDHPDSPYGLRDDAITQLVERMRTSRYAAGADVEQDAIVTEVASAFALAPEQTLLLLAKLSVGGAALLDVLKDPALIERAVVDDAEGFKNDVTPAAFADVFAAYRLVQKVTLVLTRQQLTNADDLGWLFGEHATFGLLDLNALPVRGQPGAPLFPSWLALTKWLDLRSRYPQPENATLRGVFDAAAALDVGVRTRLATLTQWRADDVEALHTALQLSYAAGDNDYLAPETYLRLERAVKAVKRLGVAAATAASWCDRDTDAAQPAIAQQTRAAAKAKYDTPTWLAKAAPLYDVVREQKRDALISYLVEYAQRNEPPSVAVNGGEYANPRRWRDTDDLLRYFLIDVEMGAAQLTSRIKQATSSLQMFVQRCFLNLEQPYVQVGEEEKADTATLNSWRQWEYMKSYAVWAAARKVFLYPENWILPELRDDKTPFFEELEAELQQGELTDEHAETALRHYLEKVHEVARLWVLAAYHEIDDDNPGDDLPPTVNLLHVVARTKTDPALYYYRRFDFNYGTWSPWEKIDVDIVGDHVLPVVYNRKLYLFWLVFVEKPQKTKKQPAAQASSNTDAPEPAKQLEIQLAWSVRTKDGWTARKVSREKLVHPWERPPESYHLKSRYKKRENLLWLDLYLSTSQEFNDTKFYDPFKNDREYLTAFRSDETARPWHSSSFVFDGGVVAVKMKPLRGYYHLVDSTGTPSDLTTYTTSLDYVQGAFGATSRTLLPLQGAYEIAPRLPLPDGMHYHFNRLANNTRKPNPGKLNVLELANTRTVLQGAKPPFELVFSQDQIRFDTGQWGAEPFLYQDLQRAFFVRSQWQPVTVGYNQVLQRLTYEFYPFYQPYSALFLRELDRSGVGGLLTRRLQRFPASYFPGDTFIFTDTYSPVAPNAADTTAETDIVDFSPSGAYSVYNWETFFHVPLLIASKLSQNQRFEEAMKWFHYIFDPTNAEELSSPQRFWVTRPFFETNSDDYRRQRIENILTSLGANLDQLRAWKNDPFNPHKIARYRPVAYQKTVVMKYLDNLIAWGDQLFAQDTIEAINQATLLYTLAHELLGRRPEKVPAPPRPDYSYNELLKHGELDPLGNESVAARIENLTQPTQNASRSPDGGHPLPLLDPLYFGIPANDQLLRYWDTVADRLFKIRHSMNIKGIVRQLPLFEPPLDPALLVKAAAAGMDVGSLAFGPQPASGQYRYRSLASTALEFCNEVKAVGDKMLSALEKRDAEGLALLRSANEITLLKATKTVRQSQLQEATDSLAALGQSLASAQAKSDYYGGRDFINAWEGTALALSGASALAQTGIAIGYIAAGGLKLIPDFIAGASGFGGSPHVVAEVAGGDKLGDFAGHAVMTLQAIAAGLDKYAGLATTIGSYTRRKEEWDFQKNLAGIEIQQINQQIAAATVHQEIAQQELDNLDLQIEQSQATDEYMHSKFTNQQLYDWMVTQISTAYFQAYKLAFDMARRAETALGFELGRTDMSFIEFGSWDSLKKGLLAADKLGIDLRRMQAAYYENNTRELELTKHISLAQFMPLSLLALRTSGVCAVQLPEWLYDMDFPGHYKRRIKSVAITVPAVVGPYGGVHATVSIKKNGIRLNDTVNGGYGDPLSTNGDSRFTSNRVPVDSIATSTGQNDSGVFELSFNDERYLPFEGAGAVSEWQITLPQSANAFDFSTISDVILHLRYTALAGGQDLKTAAANNLATVLPASGLRLFALKNEFGDDWYRFLNPATGTDQTLTLTLKPEHFPFYTREKTINATGVDLFLESPAHDAFDVKLAVPGEALPTDAAPAPADGDYGNAPHFPRQVSAAATGDWSIQVKTQAATDFRSLTEADLGNAHLVVHFATS